MECLNKMKTHSHTQGRVSEQSIKYELFTIQFLELISQFSGSNEPPSKQKLNSMEQLMER